MHHCQVVPPSWEFRELHVIWRKSRDRGTLIDLDLARVYFCKPQAWIDARTEPPTLTDREPHGTHTDW